MQQIDISKELGTDYTKYSRNKYLQKIKRKHSNAEIANINNHYYIIIPDVAMNLEELLKSDYLSDALKYEIYNVLNNKGTLRTEYRNAIVKEYSYYYESVTFNIAKSSKRKLLLGNKREHPLSKVDRKRLGNNRRPYSELGAYLTVKALNQLDAKTIFDNNTYLDERGKQHYIFTRFEWYKLIMSKPELMSKKFTVDELDTTIISKHEWEIFNQNYFVDKKRFYNKTLSSFFTRLTKEYDITIREKVVGVLSNTEKEKDIDELGYLVSNKIVVLSDTVQNDIEEHEKILLKELGIKKNKIINSSDKKVNKYKSKLSSYLFKKYNLSKIWKSISIERYGMFDESEVIDKLKINEPITDNVTNEIFALVENDWMKSLKNNIVNYGKKSDEYEYPYGYYNQILNSIVYPYLDDFYSIKPLDISNVTEILVTCINNDNFKIPAEFLEIGLTYEEVIKQFDEQDKNFKVTIDSYSILTEIKESLLQ